MRSNVAPIRKQSTPKSRLKTESVKIRTLMDQYLGGHLLLPEFQRDLVWRPKRAPLLIDSLYRGYPISALLTWTSDEDLRARHGPRHHFKKSVSWLIDGQQRVNTLARIMQGDDWADVVFNPDTEEFRLANGATRRDRRWVSVSNLFDDDHYYELRRELPEDSTGRTREARYEQVRAILDYEVPVVMMINHSFDEAVEAFTRLNTLGVKLRLADLASAQVAGKHSGFIADEVAPFLSELRDQGFSRLNAMYLFRVCEFIAADNRARVPLHELNLSDLRQAWNRTKNATAEAVTLLREEFGLQNMDILSSAAMFVPVIALCAYTPKSTRDQQAIAGWLAAAALSRRYRKGADTLDQDLRVCRSEDPIGKLLANIRRSGRGLLTTPNDFRGWLYDRGALFAVYAACHHKGLTDIFTNAPVLLSGSIERHHILPRSQFKSNDRFVADALANIAFANADTSRAGGSRSPEGYMDRLAKLSQKALASQCIPSDRELWLVDRAQEFWLKRQEKLSDAFNELLRTKLRRWKID